MVATAIVLPALSSAQNLLHGPESIAFDPDHDRYLVSCWQNGTIIEIGLDQTTQSLYHQFPNQQVLGNCVADGVFYTSRGFSPGGVAAFDLSADTLLWNIMISGSFQVDGITADTSGFLYVANVNPDRLYRIDLSDQSGRI
jgi:sugar lactone lactonase YvrE